MPTPHTEATEPTEKLHSDPLAMINITLPDGSQRPFEHPIARGEIDSHGKLAHNARQGRRRVFRGPAAQEGGVVVHPH